MKYRMTKLIANGCSKIVLAVSVDVLDVSEAKISVKLISGRDTVRPAGTPYVQSKFCEKVDGFLLTSHE